MLTQEKTQSWARVDRWATLVGWLAMIAFVCITIVPGLLGNKTFTGTDYLAGVTPWSLTAESADITNAGIGDTIDSVIPSSTFITQSAREGVFPQWNPYESGGSESGALPNYALFSPLSLPWWVMPAHAAPAAVKLLEIAAIALGFYLLLRRQWKLASCTVPFANLVFATSGFMLSWTNWPQSRVAALIPLLFWATDRLATGKQWRNAGYFALVVASMLLGGFPAVTVYAGYSVIAYFFLRFFASGRGVRELRLALAQSFVGGVLGLALSAVQILPFVWFSTHYVDWGSRAKYGGDVLSPTNLATALVGNILGTPDNTHSTWPQHYIEGMSYLGAAALVMIAVAFVVGRVQGVPRGVFAFFAVALLAVGTAVYFGGVAGRMLGSFPAIGISPIGRLRSVLGFYAAVLAALGMHSLLTTPEPRALYAHVISSPRRIAGLVVRLAGLGALVFALASQTYGALRPEGVAGGASEAEFFAQVFRNRETKIALFILAVCAVCAGAAWIYRRRVVAVVCLGTVMALTALPGTQLAREWWPLSRAGNFYPTTDVHSYLAENLGQGRYVTVGQSMMPGSSSYYRLRSVNGHTFTAPEWHDLLEYAVPGFFLAKTTTYSTIPHGLASEVIESSIFDRLGVSYLVADPQMGFEESVSGASRADSKLSLIGVEGATLIKRGSAFERIRWAGSELVLPQKDERLAAMNNAETGADTVILESAEDARGSADSSAVLSYRDVDPNTIDIRLASDGPGWVVIADPMRGNGWAAELDGEAAPLVDAEQALVAVHVESAGEHTIRLHYEAPWFRLGSAVSFLATVAVVLLMLPGGILPRLRGRRPQHLLHPDSEGYEE